MGSCVGIQDKVKAIRIGAEKEISQQDMELLRYQVNKAKVLQAPLLNLGVNKLYLKRLQGPIRKSSVDSEEGQIYEPVTLDC